MSAIKIGGETCLSHDYTEYEVELDPYLCDGVSGGANPSLVWMTAIQNTPSRSEF